MTMSDAIWTLDLVDAVIERKVPIKQKEYLGAIGFDSLGGNLESAIYCWHVDVKGQKISRFPHGAFLVKDLD